MEGKNTRRYHEGRKFISTVQKFVNDYLCHPKVENSKGLSKYEDWRLIFYFPKSFVNSIPPLQPQTILEKSLQATFCNEHEFLPHKIQCKSMTFEFVDIEVCIYFYKLFRTYATPNSIITIGNEHSELYRLDLSMAQNANIRHFIVSMKELMDIYGKDEHKIQTRFLKAVSSLHAKCNERSQNGHQNGETVEKMQLEDNNEFFDVSTACEAFEQNESVTFSQDDVGNFQHTHYMILQLRAVPPKLRTEPDIRWSQLLILLLIKRAKYEVEIAFCSTLGGAYATLKKLDKAKDYALRQLEIAYETCNERLQIRALLYYALYLISIGKYSDAQNLIVLQRKRAQELEEEQLEGLSYFIETQLQRTLQPQHQPQQQWQASFVPQVQHSEMSSVD